MRIRFFILSLLGVCVLSVSAKTTTVSPPNLQLAVDNADEGDVLLCKPGTYDSFYSYNKRIVIKSVAGPKSTFIQPSYLDRCASLFDPEIRVESLMGPWSAPQTNTCLVGFTLCNGYAPDYGQTHYVYDEWSRTYHEDFFEIGDVRMLAGCGGGVCGGTLENCIIEDCYAQLYGGGAYYADLKNCIIRNSGVSFMMNWPCGGGAYGCTLENCLVSENYSWNDSAGVCGCSAKNTTIVRNRTYRYRDEDPPGWDVHEDGIYGGYGSGVTSSTLVNCLVVENYMIFEAVYDSAWVEIFPEEEILSNWGFSHGFDHCCTVPLPTQNSGNYKVNRNNVNGDELVFQEGSFVPVVGSVVADKGVIYDSMPQTDLAGRPRIRGTTVDIGCYELFPQKTSGEYSQGVPVPMDWLDKYGYTHPGQDDELVYEAVVTNFSVNVTSRAGGDGCYRLWESYLCGLDPTNSLMRFQVMIAVTNDVPYITWSPNLNNGRTHLRDYKILGKQTLVDAAEEWVPVAEGDEGNYHFFKVCVGMPEKQ